VTVGINANIYKFLTIKKPPPERDDQIRGGKKIKIGAIAVLVKQYNG
jgi:hypothetical protein